MNNVGPLISIITPCYNSEKTISKTIESVLNQSYKNFEYIIIDGKSTDNTLSIIHAYEASFDGRMTVISEPDSGIYDAMNKGIGKASGLLIGIVNSDDYLEADAFENVVRAHVSDNEIIYGAMRIFDSNRLEKIVFFHHEFLDKQMINHPTCFVSAKVYKMLGVYDTNYRSSADYEFLLRAAHSDFVRFVPIENIISNFAAGGMSSTQVGVRETARLRYQYHIISRLRYFRIMIQSVIYELIHKKS